MSKTCEHTHCIVIRHKTHQDLVLHATKSTVQLQTYDGSPPQIWKLVMAGLGRYFIMNHLDGNMLSLRPNCNSRDMLHTRNFDGGDSQRWHVNSDGSIVCVNPIVHLAVDVYDSNYKAGINLIGEVYHGNVNQQFVLTLYNKDSNKSSSYQVSSPEQSSPKPSSPEQSSPKQSSPKQSSPKPRSPRPSTPQPQKEPRWSLPPIPLPDWPRPIGSMNLVGRGTRDRVSPTRSPRAPLRATYRFPPETRAVYVDEPPSRAPPLPPRNSPPLPPRYNPPSPRAPPPPYPNSPSSPTTRRTSF